MTVTLVTGGDGYFGNLVVSRSLERGDEVLATVRAGDRSSFRTKHARLRDHHPQAIDSGQLLAVPVELTDDDPFGLITARQRHRITRIIHTAAITRFDVDKTTARRVNVRGTAHVARLARDCTTLDVVASCSSIYASGLRDGFIPEQPLEQVGFANHYEWSKWQAERIATDLHPDLPWQILRLATIIADDTAGTVTQHNAFHTTLRLLYAGLLPLVPGRADVPVYLIPGAPAAATVEELTRPGAPTGVFHLAPGRPDSLTLGRLLDVAFSCFEQDPSFERRRVLRPPLADLESYELLSESLGSLERSLAGQVIRTIDPFARQLFIPKDLEVSRLRNEPWPGPEAFVGATVAQLVRSRWGRCGSARCGDDDASRSDRASDALLEVAS